MSHVFDLLEESDDEQPPARMSQELRAEYSQVRFLCDLSEPPPAFFIVTAHNAKGVTADERVNRLADEHLRAMIDRLGYTRFSVTGGNSDFTHSEPGYGISCSRQVALNLARKFDQHAIFEVRGGRVFLVSKIEGNEPDVEVGRWDELLSDP